MTARLAAYHAVNLLDHGLACDAELMNAKLINVEYALEPLMDDQELDTRANTGTIYWEGAVRAIRAGQEVGRGYLELTGYWKPLKL